MKTERTIIVSRDDSSSSVCYSIWAGGSKVYKHILGGWCSDQGDKRAAACHRDVIKALFGRIPRRGGKLVFRVEAI